MRKIKVEAKNKFAYEVVGYILSNSLPPLAYTYYPQSGELYVLPQYIERALSILSSLWEEGLIEDFAPPPEPLILNKK